MDGITSLFGLSNLYLLKQSTDYCSINRTQRLHHTWSLGVEEHLTHCSHSWFGFQDLTTNKEWCSQSVPGVGLLTIASLVGFLSLPNKSTSSIFPDAVPILGDGSRMSDLIGFQKRASPEQLLEKVPPLLVMALMVGVMYLPMSMASESTVAVVVLSSIPIACLKKQTAAFKVFTNPKVVYVGLISYSLYLWHWGCYRSVVYIGITGGQCPSRSPWCWVRLLRIDGRSPLRGQLVWEATKTLVAGGVHTINAFDCTNTENTSKRSIGISRRQDLSTFALHQTWYASTRFILPSTTENWECFPRLPCTTNRRQ